MAKVCAAELRRAAGCAATTLSKPGRIACAAPLPLVIKPGNSDQCLEVGAQAKRRGHKFIFKLPQKCPPPPPRILNFGLSPRFQNPP
jgi:hypothetical protein